MLSDYTDQESRIDRAFSYGGSCCTEHCEACGRTYFVTSPGHGDYSEGELENLRKLAEERPNEYIEVADYSSVSYMYHPFTAKSVVIGCICGPTSDISQFIERYAAELTEYLEQYWQQTRLKRAMELKESEIALRSLGWIPMSLAPKDSTWIEVETTDHKIVSAHWASDLSGSEQPPFEGWFVKQGDGYSQVFPIHWRKASDVDQSKTD